MPPKNSHQHRETRRSEPSIRTSAPRGSGRWLMVMGVVVGALLILQLVASPIAKNMLNRKLAELTGYTGKVDGVSVAFWKVGLELKNFTLWERGREQELPVINLQKASFRFAPSALFKGKLAGGGTIDGVEVNVIKWTAAPSDEESAQKMEEQIQKKKEAVQRWQNVLREAFPMSLERLEVKNSRLRFIDRSHQPNVDLAIDHLQIIATDLQNRPKGNGDTLPAHVEVTGVMTGGGKLKISLRLDPVARQPRFALNFELRELSLPELNSFLLAYADADVSRGSFEVFSEINAEGGAYEGYLKPLIRDVEFTTPSDKDKSLGARMKEAVVGAVSSILENKEEAQVATRAPFAGNFANNELDVWTTIVNLMRNAFVQAIRGGLEGQAPSRE